MTKAGDKFNRLTAIEPAGHEEWGARRALWRFRCDCGTEHTARVEGVRSGRTKSCGCLKIETTAAMGRANITHGLEGTRIYRIWGAMLGRCENPKHYRFEYYGGRGISVCDEWHDIHRFREWALTNGYADDLTIDRFPDKDGNYEPTNCRWATWSEQALNRRKKRWYRKPPPATT
jgi:hypothetical protein